MEPGWSPQDRALLCRLPASFLQDKETAGGSTVHSKTALPAIHYYTSIEHLQSTRAT